MVMEQVNQSILASGNATQSALFVLPSIPGVVIDVRQIRWTRGNPTGGSSGATSIGLSHDLSILVGTPVLDDKDVWWGMLVWQGQDLDLAHAHAPIDYFDPPYPVAGPQALFIGNVLGGGFTELYHVQLYFTRRSVSLLEWTGLLRRTSFGG